mgnify:CR=1 FL=1
MKRTQLILTALLLILIGTSASAQNLKIGFVDSQKIFEGLPEAKEAQKHIDAKQTVWRVSLETMSKNFQSEYEAFKAQEGMMADGVRQEKLQTLAKEEQAIRAYQEMKFGQSGEASRLRQSVLSPLQDKVLQAIQDVAKAEGLNFVFDKIEDATLLLYAEAKFDYTFKVLDMLKRGSK